MSNNRILIYLDSRMKKIPNAFITFAPSNGLINNK